MGDKLAYATFLHRVSERAGGRVADVDRFLRRLGPVFASVLEEEERATVHGFGSFRRPQKVGPGIAGPDYVHFLPFALLRWSANWPYRFDGMQLLSPEEGAGTEADEIAD